MKQRLFVLTATVVLLSCGGPGSVQGSIAGRNIEVKSAAMVEQVTAQTTLRYVVLSDQPDICTVLKANRQPKVSNSLFITLTPLSGGTPVPLTLGDYTIATPPSAGTGKYASASLHSSDGNCREQVPLDQRTAKSGFVTVTSLDNGKHIAGTFDLTMTEKITGSFSADWCPVAVSQDPPRCE